MIKAKGPVWHKKQKSQGVIPKGLRGLDQEATWSCSKTDGWVYGHGSFCITSYDIPVLGQFRWMPNSAHEGKRLKIEIVKFSSLVEKVFVDSKADDQKLYFHLKDDYGIQLVTSSRRKNKTPKRKLMFKQIRTRQNLRDYKKRSTNVEPMQGLVKDIFDLQTCWMRGDANNRWLFAAMGIAVQIAQLHAYRNNLSTWNIKEAVLGL